MILCSERLATLNIKFFLHLLMVEPLNTSFAWFTHNAVYLHSSPLIISLFFFQNAIVSFKELCGLSAVANLKQCILALSPRLTGPDNSPLVVFNLTDQYPNLEPQGLLPEVLKKVVSTYDMVSNSYK